MWSKIKTIFSLLLVKLPGYSRKFRATDLYGWCLHRNLMFLIVKICFFVFQVIKTFSLFSIKLLFTLYFLLKINFIELLKLLQNSKIKFT